MEKSPRFLIALAVPAVAGLCAGCSCGHRSVRVDLDDTCYVVQGEGSPTIVLEAGIGDDHTSWSPVFDDIAALTTTFAYSRAGYANGSRPRHPTDGRRTAGDAVSFLRQTLRSVDLPPPYVLVGHSTGGLYLLHFAALHPEEVAGIVLVDARLPGFRDECRTLGLDSCRPPGGRVGRAPDHVREEIRGLPASEASAPTARELGGIPVTVIAAARPPPRASAERQRLWLDLQRRYAEDAANGRFVAAEGCGHYVHRDDPALVSAEVRSLLRRIGD